jgi:hypothetical protein
MNRDILTSNLINTKHFIDHYITRERVIEIYLPDNVQCVCNKINSMVEDLDIKPYLYIIEVHIPLEKKKRFYLFLNKYVNFIEPVNINGCEDINTPFIALCFIYMVQYIFL